MTDVHLSPQSASEVSRQASDPSNERIFLAVAFAPGGEADPLRPPLGRLVRGDWMPEQVRVEVLFAPTDIQAALEATVTRMGELRARGVLVLDAERSARRFRVEMRAENRIPKAAPRENARRIAAVGPSVARATGPVADLCAALAGAGLPVRASSDAQGGPGNALLYRLLTEFASTSAGPSVGLLRVPGGAGRLPEAELERGLKVAFTAFAETLGEPTAWS